MDQLIPLLLEKKHDIASIISHRMPLSEGRAAYEMFDKKKDDCTKIVLEP
jgi:threonine dehydrogenase-like Zn-dependent dehydrogenase